MTHIFTLCLLIFAFPCQSSSPFIKHLLCTWYCDVSLAFFQLTPMHIRTLAFYKQDSKPKLHQVAEAGEQTAAIRFYPNTSTGWCLVKCPVFYPHPWGQEQEQLHLWFHTSLSPCEAQSSWDLHRNHPMGSFFSALDVPEAAANGN